MGLFDIFRASKIKAENELLKARLAELGCDEYEQVKEKIRQMEAEHSNNVKAAQSQLNAINTTIATNNSLINKIQEELSSLSSKDEKIQKQIQTQTRKLQRVKELYKSVDYCITNFLDNDISQRLSLIDESEYDEFAPSVTLKLHCMDIKSLRKAYKENDKAIDKILSSYAKRYTTKANRSIYQLMVIALRAELQNTLYDLKFEKLDHAIDNIKKITQKYLKIAGDGNQNIAGTLTKFIGEIEYLFINAVKIEYNYYVKKEQARQEQLAIKQQMREEAEERKLLEQQRKKIEAEESKYQIEIDKANEALSYTTDTKQIANLKAKILELQGLLSDVAIKKEDISKLQNGKAGNVYIISNLGSFGDNIFKIGMTRRINPQDRVDELGNASVPFRYDVHSFIFSDDAVGLENKLHTILNNKRVNKVNMRKEFFYATLDELESLVNDLDPTAEFNKTMIAEEFYQSQSVDTPYTSDYSEESDEEDDY
jgi:archaellum component FlaC